MDDEELIRSVIRKMLAASGYASCMTRSGDEAISKFRSAKADDKPFDAVILDLNVSSGMAGGEAISQLHRLDPTVKVVLLTGDITHPAVARYEECGFKTVLLKPFTRDELMEALKSAIRAE